MADEKDAPTVPAHVRDDRQERVGLLGCQHARRLVEDEEARALHDGLEDLDPLALPGGEARDLGAHADRETVTFRELGRALVQCPGRAPEGRAAQAHGEVLRDRVPPGEVEMLGHEAYAEVHGVPRVLDGDAPAIHGDAAAVGLE